jgi:quercetin dioxygenase-like cupin family protein
MAVPRAAVRSRRVNQRPVGSGPTVAVNELGGSMSGTIRHIDDADDLVIHDEHIRPVLTHAMGSQIEVCEQSGPTGSGPPPHRHPWDEVFVVLEGELDVSIGDQSVSRVGAGSVVHVPSGTAHSFRLVSDGTRMLSITNQGRAAEMFQAVAEVAPTEYAATLANFGHSRVNDPHPHLRGYGGSEPSRDVTRCGGTSRFVRDRRQPIAGRPSRRAVPRCSARR